jgi:large subunit ribosomal protein L14
MIFKQSWLSVSDNTNVRWLQIFHLYKGFYRKSTKVGFFVKGTARVVEPPRIEYKGFKFKYNKKGDICRGLIIRNKFNIQKADGSSLYFLNNNLILLKKKQDVKSKYLYGPIPYSIKRKKFLSLFSFVF